MGPIAFQGKTLPFVLGCPGPLPQQGSRHLQNMQNLPEHTWQQHVDSLPCWGGERHAHC
jgi:hypothetical protein